MPEGTTDGDTTGDTDGPSSLSATTDATPSQTSAQTSAPPDGTDTSGTGTTDGTDAAHETSNGDTASSGSGDPTTSTSSGEFPSSSTDTSAGSSSSGESSSSSTDASSSSGLADSSSSTGGVDGCYTEAWSVVVDDISYIAQIAAVADGLVYATGPSSLDAQSAWVGAWDQDGIAAWSRAVEADEFGLADDDGTFNQPAAVDIDVLLGGDALLGFQDVFVPTSAVFVRLDAATGDTVWATAVGESELAPLEPMYSIYGSTPFGAAVTGSGRIFVVGAAPTDFYTMIYASELDPATGAGLWLAATDAIDSLSIHGYEGRGVAAHDDAGLFYGDAWDALGPGFGGDVHRVSLEGEALGELGPEDLGYFHSLSIDETGELALAWVSISSFEPEAIHTPYLERRSSDFTLLAGGLAASPALGGYLAFEADGDILLVGSDIRQLDADLNVESVDGLEGSRWSIATQSDGSFVLGGAEAGEPVVEKYDGCGL